MRTQVLSCLVVVVLVALVAVGCRASGKTGTQMPPDKLSQIKKGVTTRAEVEQLLGPPLSSSPRGSDGRQTLFYHGTSVTTKMGVVQYIPIIGGVIPNENKTATRTQTLQIVLSKDNVVEDCDFSDTTRTDTTRTTMFGGNVESKTTTQPAP